MVSDSEVFQVRDQPPPVIVECMSQSELCVVYMQE